MRLRESITSDGIWVVSEFAIPDNWYGRLIARPVVTVLYLSIRIADRPCHP